MATAGQDRVLRSGQPNMVLKFICPINRSINQSINQSISQSVSRSYLFRLRGGGHLVPGRMGKKALHLC